MKKRKHRTGSVSKTAGRYMARLPDAKRTSLGYYDTKEEAHRALDIYVCEAAKNGVVIGEGVTLGDYLESFMTQRELSGRVRDIQNEWSRVRLHMLPTPLAKTPMKDITRPLVQRWADAKRKELSHQSVKHCRRIMSQAFEEAIQERLCTVNPTKGIRIAQDEKGEEAIHFLTPVEIKKLLSTPNILSLKQWQVFSIAIFTGLRQGEMFGLHWSDVHLDVPQPYLLVRYSWDRPASKNGKVQRVPLTPMAVRLFKAIKQDNEYVWHSESGAAHCSRYAAGWPTVKKALGLNPSVTFHGLRHTCATSLLSGVFGPPLRLEAVQQVMRHSTIVQTQTYAKLLQDDLHAALATQTGFEQREQHKPDLRLVL